MIPRIRSQLSASITGPIWTPSSKGRPTTSPSVSATTRSSTASYTESSTSRRVGSTHPCPLAGTSPACTAVAAAASRSASPNTTLADLPPSSSTIGVRLRAAASMILRAVVVPPVKLILPTRESPTRAAPASAPPVTTLTTPGGTPASRHSSANRNGPRGASSAGLSTTQLPAARAGATFIAGDTIPPFHGVSTATTP